MSMASLITDFNVKATHQTTRGSADLGLPLELAGLVWLTNPIVGFFLQPIIGVVSDRSRSPWGRRRPFIVLFSLVGYGSRFCGTFCMMLHGLLAHKWVFPSFVVIRGSKMAHP